MGIILVVLLLLRLRVFKDHGVATGNPWLLAKLFPAAYPPYKHVTKMLIPYIL